MQVRPRTISSADKILFEKEPYTRPSTITDFRCKFAHAFLNFHHQSLPLPEETNVILHL